MKNILVTGSLAYDRISVFKDKFSNHIMPDKIHQLNVCFTVDDMKVEHGGTAMGIAYNLALMAESAYVFATLGHDGGPLLKTLEDMGTKTDHVKKIDDLITANCTIMTDLSDNQIIAFCDGALARAHESTFEQFEGEAFMAIISPNELTAMQRCAQWCREKNIPFIADPGQRIPIFSKEELIQFIQKAHILIANDYEWELIKQKTGWTEESVLYHVTQLIITLGERGSRIISKEGVLEIPPVLVENPVDPTGAGDAYRAGLIYGLKNDHPLERSAQIGAWLAAKCVMQKGTQNHKIDLDDFERYIKN